MKIAKIAEFPFRFKPWRSRHARLIARDLISKTPQPEHDDAVHLEATVDWLCRAQDVRANCTDRGGVSGGWSFEDGWLPSYPYTSGYLVETFVAAAGFVGRTDLLERSQRIIDWLLSIQRDDGAFPGHFGESGSHPVIFNTGQIMHGMLAGYHRFKKLRCLDAALRAGRWLARLQEGDGSWRRYEHLGISHTYNTRTAWALLATGLVAGERSLVEAAVRNLDWAMAQQRDTGWFDKNAFAQAQQPFSHNVAYAIRGFIECGALLREDSYFAAAQRAAHALAKVQRADGWIAGTLDAQWRSKARYACLSGNAQMALCWMRLAQERGIDEFRDSAKRAVGFIKRQQRVADADLTVRGGVAGSAPIWGDFARFEFPNWAAKFFADALMMQMSDQAVPPLMIEPASLAPAQA